MYSRTSPKKNAKTLCCSFSNNSHTKLKEASSHCENYHVHRNKVFSLYRSMHCFHLHGSWLLEVGSGKRRLWLMTESSANAESRTPNSESWIVNLISSEIWTLYAELWTPNSSLGHLGTPGRKYNKNLGGKLHSESSVLVWTAWAGLPIADEMVVSRRPFCMVVTMLTHESTVDISIKVKFPKRSSWNEKLQVLQSCVTCDHR